MRLHHTNKGKPRYLQDGKTYTLDKMSKDGQTEFWRCDYRASCKARLHIRDGKIVKRVNEHTHIGDPAKVEVLRALMEIGKQAETTNSETEVVVAEATRHLSPACRESLPAMSNLKRMIQRKRAPRTGVSTLSEPQNLSSLEIPDEFTRYEKSPDQFEDFLLHDSGSIAGEERILIFSTEQNLNLLCRSDAWYLDGSLDKTPPLFSQLYSIHGLYCGQTYPLVFGLLPNKSQATYENFFSQLNDLTYGNLSPASVFADYEDAAINALQIVFPETQISGCFFHLSEDIHRNIQKEDLQQQYERDPEFAVQCRMITALAFVPPEDVTDVFNLLEEFVPQTLQPILNYFEDNFIGDGDQREPLFPIVLWNTYHRTLNGEDCTTRSLETWHRFVQSLVCEMRPSIWKFLRGILRRQKMRDAEIESVIQGNLPPKRYRSATINQRILDVVNHYKHKDKLEYLRELALHI